MSVAADEQRPGGALRSSVFHNRLCGGQDVRLVERPVQTGAAMPRRAERHLLVDVVGVGVHRVVRGDQMGQIDEVFGERRLAGAGVSRHGANSAPLGAILARGFIHG